MSIGPLMTYINETTTYGEIGSSGYINQSIFPHCINLITTSTHATFSLAFGATGQALLGQTFVMPSTFTVLNGCSFWLSKFGSPSDNLVCDIYAVDGTHAPVTPSLGTSGTVAGSSITDALATFTFSSSVILSPSTEYAAVLSRSGALDNSNYYLGNGDDPGTYSAGRGLNGSFGGGFSVYTQTFVLYADICTDKLDQQHYRFRTDTNAVDASPTWGANEDSQFSYGGSSAFRLRVGIENPASGITPTSPFNLYVSVNGGTYEPVTTSSLYVTSADASSSSDETPVLVQRLSD